MSSIEIFCLGLMFGIGLMLAITIIYRAFENNKNRKHKQKQDIDKLFRLYYCIRDKIEFMENNNED